MRDGRDFEELTRSGLDIIYHRQGSVSELSRGVGSSVNTSNLHKFLSNIFVRKISRTLAQTKHILLCLEHLGNLLVNFAILFCQGHIYTLGHQFHVTDECLTFLLDLLVEDSCLLVREPNADKRHSHDLRDKRLDIRVTETTFHVEPDVLIILGKLGVGNRRRSLTSKVQIECTGRRAGEAHLLGA